MYKQYNCDCNVESFQRPSSTLEGLAKPRSRDTLTYYDDAINLLTYLRGSAPLLDFVAPPLPWRLYSFELR